MPTHSWRCPVCGRGPVPPKPGGYRRCGCGYTDKPKDGKKEESRNDHTENRI